MCKECVEISGAENIAWYFHLPKSVGDFVGFVGAPCSLIHRKDDWY
jgi:hypothetical protein